MTEDRLLKRLSTIRRALRSRFAAHGRYPPYVRVSDDLWTSYHRWAREQELSRSWPMLWSDRKYGGLLFYGVPLVYLKEQPPHSTPARKIHFYRSS